MKLPIILVITTIIQLCNLGDGFAFNLPTHAILPVTQTFRASKLHSWSNILNDFDEESGTSPVLKKVIKEGDGQIPSDGSIVEIEYVGSLGKSQQEVWNVDDVIECWLKNQQGLYDILAETMREKNVDGSVLFDEEKFTEEYVAMELGVENKIQCKKTIMAAKRLRKSADEFPEGTKFDSSFDKGKNYEFVLGKGKVIKAMDLLVASMRVGETAQVACRADFGYGSEGFRKSTGEVVVPPFATLNFEVTLISASTE